MLNLDLNFHRKTNTQIDTYIHNVSLNSLSNNAIESSSFEELPNERDKIIPRGNVKQVQRVGVAGFREAMPLLRDVLNIITSCFILLISSHKPTLYKKGSISLLFHKITLYIVAIIETLFKNTHFSINFTSDALTILSSIYTCFVYRLPSNAC